MSDEQTPATPPVPPTPGTSTPPPAPPAAAAPAAQPQEATDGLDDLDFLVNLALDAVPDPVILKAGTKVNLECTSAKLKISRESRNVYIGFAFNVVGMDAEPIFDNFHTLPTNRDSDEDAKKKKRRIKEMATRFGVPFQAIDNYLTAARPQLIQDPTSVDNCQEFIGKVCPATLKVDTSGDSPRNVVGTWG